MKKEKSLKILGVGAILLLVLNMVLFALQITNGLIFWGVIIFWAIFAFVVLPKLKK